MTAHNHNHNFHLPKASCLQWYKFACQEKCQGNKIGFSCRGVSQQAAQEFTGYRMPFWVHTMYVLVALMTGGLLWLLADHPLGKPPWAMQRCHLKDAEYVLVQVGASYPPSVPCFQQQALPETCHCTREPWVLLQMAERKFKLAKVRGYPRQNLHGLRSQVQTAYEALAPFLCTLALKHL